MTIDILMPFYGDPDQFKQAVQSVIAQHDTNWRLTVLNDDYPHWDPAEWVNSLADERVALIRNSENLGVQGSFDRCIDLATEEYATIIGCDDRLLPNYVGTVRSLIEQFDRPDYAQPGVAVIDDSGARVMPLADRVKRLVQPKFSTPTLLEGESAVTTLMRGNWTYFPAICWRVDRLREFRFAEQYEIVLDLAMQFDILTDGGRFAVSPDEAFEYRRHSASASSYTASDGTRFVEERDFYHAAGTRLTSLAWKRAARSARWRITSRLNALSMLPQALIRRQRSACRLLLHHGLSN